MATRLRLQYLIVICVCLHAKLFHGFPYSGPSPSIDGIKIITYGEPCHTPHYLPVKIEKPAPPVEDCVAAKPYQPLQLNYQAINRVDQSRHMYNEYPVSIEMPQVTPAKPCPLDLLRGRSYTYSTQVPPPPPTPIASNYNLDVQVLPLLPVITTPQKPVKLLTGLTSRIDRVVIPACDKPSPCSCKSHTI